MKEFKGTPSPWVRCKGSPKIIMSGYVFNVSEGYLIGSVFGNDNSGFYANEDEAEANARLIAAAPDLLEALLRTKAQYMQAGIDAVEGSLNPVENNHAFINAAISKALGE